MPKCIQCDREAEWFGTYCQEHWEEDCAETWHAEVDRLNAEIDRANSIQSAPPQQPEEYSSLTWRVVVVQIPNFETDRAFYVGKTNLLRNLCERLGVVSKSKPVQAQPEKHCKDCRYFNPEALMYINSGCAVHPNGNDAKTCPDFKLR